MHILPGSTPTLDASDLARIEIECASDILVMSLVHDLTLARKEALKAEQVEELEEDLEEVRGELKEARESLKEAREELNGLLSRIQRLRDSL